MISRSRLWDALPLALLAGLPWAGARAESIDWTVGVASSTVLRGVAVGEGGVDAHVAATYLHPSGWRATLGATALHSKLSRRYWDAQWFWRLGYGRRLDDDWSAQLGFARYSYSGSALRRYGYDELGTTLAYRDLLYLSIAGLRRGDAQVGRRTSVAYDLVARHALPASLTVSAGLGRLETRGRSTDSYGYGHLGLDAPWGATQAQLTYIATDAAAKRRLGEAAANRWVASLSWNF
jgi:uncharacterized protein (TIGR02001 family)